MFPFLLAVTLFYVKRLAWPLSGPTATPAPSQGQHILRGTVTVFSGNKLFHGRRLAFGISETTKLI